MKRKFGFWALLYALVCFLPVAALAAEAFFEALYDVPVMPGLEELPGEAMLFDKPGGRIASVMAASRKYDTEEISAFYRGVLPQLGWKKTAANQYVRGEDQLVLELSRKPPLTVVHFTLSPLKAE